VIDDHHGADLALRAACPARGCIGVGDGLVRVTTLGDAGGTGQLAATRDVVMTATADREFKRPPSSTSVCFGVRVWTLW